MLYRQQLYSILPPTDLSATSWYVKMLQTNPTSRQQVPGKSVQYDLERTNPQQVYSKCVQQIGVLWFTLHWRQTLQYNIVNEIHLRKLDCCTVSDNCHDFPELIVTSRQIKTGVLLTTSLMSIGEFVWKIMVAYYSHHAVSVENKYKDSTAWGKSFNSFHSKPLDGFIGFFASLFLSFKYKDMWANLPLHVHPGWLFNVTCFHLSSSMNNSSP